jgi:DNA-directed RNA polymerase subunit M/transcription elongation factor TFIIS
MLKREEEGPGEGDDCLECGDILVPHEAGDLKTIMCQGCGYSPDLGDDGKAEA